MKIKSLSGHEVDLKQEVLDTLKVNLRGPVLLQDDDGYEASRTIWNAMIDKKPAVIARCLGTADVITCVKFAREHDLLLCIKGGGITLPGWALPMVR